VGKTGKYLVVWDRPSNMTEAKYKMLLRFTAELMVSDPDRNIILVAPIEAKYKSTALSTILKKA